MSAISQAYIIDAVHSADLGAHVLNALMDRVVAGGVPAHRRGPGR
ncbi:hypothetical protein [Streptomyces collinus]